MLYEDTLVRAVAADERRRRSDPCGPRDSGPASHGGWSAGQMARQQKMYSISERDLERLDDGRVITVRPVGWLRGQLGGQGDTRFVVPREVDVVLDPPEQEGVRRERAEQLVLDRPAVGLSLEAAVVRAVVGDPERAHGSRKGGAPLR